ncbi:hypothetical protein NX625_004097 [Vibrio parahaemolyticus]|uniref:hypothetical protein n=1 Tax=Vibrio parahaemolyticus TaxID=670 RepID=UPI0035546855|nr:hypothetical protein [Vibrio parahaemolyticus]
MNTQNNVSQKYSKCIMLILFILLSLQGILPSLSLINEKNVTTISLFIIIALLIGAAASIQTFYDKGGFDNKTAASIISVCIAVTLVLWAIIADGYGIPAFKFFTPPVIAISLFLGGALSLIYEDKQSHQKKSLSSEQKNNLKSLFINAIVISVGLYFVVYSNLIDNDNNHLISAVISCVGLAVFWYDMSNFVADKYHYSAKELLNIKSIWFTFLSGVVTLITTS